MTTPTSRLNVATVEAVSVLGLHEIRTTTAPHEGPFMLRLVDGRTNEPIAIMHSIDAREFAQWLEAERPLPPRPITFTIRRGNVPVIGELGDEQS